ncbi:MAG: zf-HC2 domain-containing protein [Myxococcota bacterium]|nr:zf-HC2 domain-containing protein [Myxococcota bacterium]
MSVCERIELLLHGYHDGELHGWSRWRVERHLAGCPGCRGTLASLDQLGGWIRETVAAPESPELWSGIASRLPSLDAREREPETAGWAPRLRAPRILAPLLGSATVAAALAGLLLWIGPLAPRTASAGMVLAVYSHGPPVVVLDDGPDDIIWVIDEGTEESHLDDGTVVRAGHAPGRLPAGGVRV